MLLPLLLSHLMLPGVAQDVGLALGPMDALSAYLDSCLIVLPMAPKGKEEMELDPPKDIYGFLVTGIPGIINRLEIKINKRERLFKAMGASRLSAS